MSADNNKQVYRRLVEELFNQRKMGVVDELVAVDLIEHEELPPEAPEGRESIRWFARVFSTAFPDWQVTLHDLLAEGDKVVGRATMTGTHQGEFMGIPATGKRIEVGLIDIVRIADGRIAEHWGLTDSLALMQQLGAVSEPDQAGI